MAAPLGQHGNTPNTQLRLEIGSLRIDLGSKSLTLAAPCTLTTGRVYLVSGPSGSGKSSFARALLGFGELSEPRIPCQGRISLYDCTGGVHPIWGESGYSPASREVIAFLPQSEKLGFLDGLTPRENLCVFSHLDAKCAIQHAEALARRFHLSAIPERLARASGGERIRLSAIRGLVPRNAGEGPPPLVIADEPTAGLDPHAARALAKELIDLAHAGESIVVVITHDPALFTPDIPDELPTLTSATPNVLSTESVSESLQSSHHPVQVASSSRTPFPGIRIIECCAKDQPDQRACVVAQLQMVAIEASQKRWKALLDHSQIILQAVGSVTLAPVAVFWGALGVRRPTRLLIQIARDVFNVGTFLFALTGTLLVAGTVSYFIFEQTPKPELVEPLLLPEILRATGHTLVRVVLPLAACSLVATKLGAAQAARLAAAVRSGLLETLALARWRIESYALLPTVAAQIATMLFATTVALFFGMLTASLVYSTGHQGADLRLSMEMMITGVLKAPRWREFLLTKVITSGFLAGTIAAYFGTQPATSEDDVAQAVHRTLLWGVLCVIVCQCITMIVEFTIAK